MAGFGPTCGGTGDLGPARLRVGPTTRKLATPDTTEDEMAEDGPAREPNGSSFQKTLIRVLIVQIIALALLALLQLRYHG